MASNSIQTREEPNKLVALNNALAKGADQFKMALPAHISVEKFQRTILTAVQNDPQLLDADRGSLLLACMRCAQDGLLPDKREAALVIFKENKNVNGQWQTKLLVQYMPMVYGLRKKILQSGDIADITTNVVYIQEIAAGCFVYEEGTERVLRHKPILDPNFEPTDDDLACAYSMATFKDGTVSFEVMRASEIRKVQEKSQTGATKDRQGKDRKPSGPWVEWKSEQWRKTVMRRHSKSLPMSGDLIDVEVHDDEMSARSAAAVLSAPQTAPALSAMPSRSDKAGEQIDADGVVTDRSPDAAKEAADSSAVAATSTDSRADDGSGASSAQSREGFVPTGNDEIDVGMNRSNDQEKIADGPTETDWSKEYDRINAKIEKAESVASVNRITKDIYSDMPKGWRDGLEKRGAERIAELKGPK
jgi:recombination protein RecT